MTNSNNQNNTPDLFPASLIIRAGLIAGTLDICLAFLYSYIKRGTMPGKVLQYISAMVFKKTAFTEPVVSGTMGLLIHFAIAMGWTILFFMIYPKLKLSRVNTLVTGMAYGLFVWTIMNTAILPLWNGKPYVFNIESFVVNAVILIIAIGLPLSFIAKQQYIKKNN